MSSVVDVILLEQKTFHYEPGDSLFQTRDWGDEWRKAKIFLFVLEKKKKKKNPILCLLRMAGSFVPLRGSARRLDQSVAQKLGYLLI